MQEMIYVGDALFPGGMITRPKKQESFQFPLKVPRKPSELSKQSSLAWVTINKREPLRWIDGETSSCGASVW